MHLHISDPKTPTQEPINPLSQKVRNFFSLYMYTKGIQKDALLCVRRLIVLVLIAPWISRLDSRISRMMGNVHLSGCDGIKGRLFDLDRCLCFVDTRKWCFGRG